MSLRHMQNSRGYRQLICEETSNRYHIFLFVYSCKKKKQLKKFAKDDDRKMRIVRRGSFKITIYRETLPDKTLFITHAEK